MLTTRVFGGSSKYKSRKLDGYANETYTVACDAE